MLSEPKVLTDYFEDRAAISADSPAYFSRLDDKWQAINWGAFVKRARKIASSLEIAPGDVVGILAPTSLEWELAQVAILMRGGAVVGLDAHDLPERLAQIVETSNLKGLIIGELKVLNRLPEVAIESLGWMINLSDEPKPTAWAPQWPSQIHNFSAMELKGNDTFQSRARPDSLATIIFTSGSTGRPKGISYTHSQVCVAIEDILDTFPEITAGDRLVCWLPLSNLFQRMINFCAAGRGAQTYFVSDPRQIIERLPEIKPHLFISVPRFFEKLHEGMEAKIREGSPTAQRIAAWALRQGDLRATAERAGRSVGFFSRIQIALADRLVLSRLRAAMGGEIRFMVSGSAPLSSWLIERFHAMGMLILEAYGLSENVTPVAINRVEDYRFGSVGRPLSSNSVAIAEDGEVIVKGPGVFSGYLGANKSAAAIDEQGYLHTGDLGVLDDAGHVHLVGRKSEIFKTSTGRKVAPVPIESKLKRLTGIDYAVLIGAGRKFTVAILAPSLEIENELTDESKFAAFIENQRAQFSDLLADEQDYARPMGILVTNNSFSIESGELTSNLKLRRGVIEAKYLDAIEALYEKLSTGEQSHRFIEPVDANMMIASI